MFRAGQALLIPLSGDDCREPVVAAGAHVRSGAAVAASDVRSTAPPRFCGHDHDDGAAPAPASAAVGRRRAALISSVASERLNRAKARDGLRGHDDDATATAAAATAVRRVASHLF